MIDLLKPFPCRVRVSVCVAELLLSYLLGLFRSDSNVRDSLPLLWVGGTRDYAEAAAQPMPWLSLNNTTRRARRGSMARGPIRRRQHRSSRAARELHL